MSGSLRLVPELLARINELGHADLVVGIPSYNNASTIGHVVRAVLAGLAKHFPDQRAVLVNSDGGSTDATREVVASASFSTPETILVSHPLTTVHKILTPYHGLPGKGSAFRTIFAVADALGARGCAVVDSDLRSITPEWMELLLGPVLDKTSTTSRRCTFVTNTTARSPTSIVYPLTRALYGKERPTADRRRLRLFRAARVALSRQAVWGTNVARFGIDIWMTTTAIADGFRVCQAFLGAKIHDPKDPGADLSRDARAGRLLGLRV